MSDELPLETMATLRADRAFLLRRAEGLEAVLRAVDRELTSVSGPAIRRARTLISRQLVGDTENFADPEVDGGAKRG